MSWTSRSPRPCLRVSRSKNASRSRNGLRTTARLDDVSLDLLEDDVRIRFDQVGRKIIQNHGVKMLSLVEKLEDLKVGLDNDTRGFNLQGEMQEDWTLEEEKGKGKGFRSHCQRRGRSYYPNGKGQKEKEGWKFSMVEGK
ncbi:UNVERIFIED_CONTAM: hypothetical protein Sangu_2933600 [Sesamum angustifolium]|uniref:Uncharacterized protein n=1 Tax=Sesamum angustifolium TaxID=2727405 RepID=A0AAW2IKA6_9LAMI